MSCNFALPPLSIKLALPFALPAIPKLDLPSFDPDLDLPALPPLPAMGIKIALPFALPAIPSLGSIGLPTIDLDLPGLPPLPAMGIKIALPFALPAIPKLEIPEVECPFD